MRKIQVSNTTPNDKVKSFEYRFYHHTNLVLRIISNHAKKNLLELINFIYFCARNNLLNKSVNRCFTCYECFSFKLRQFFDKISIAKYGRR
jgi:hypothetical protein